MKSAFEKWYERAELQWWGALQIWQLIRIKNYSRRAFEAGRRYERNKK